MSKSIIQTKKECYVCKVCYGLETTRSLEQHHCLHGTANRSLADKHGLWLWLCPEHHRGQTGVHHDAEMDLRIKRIAQACFEKTKGSRQDFMNIFGKNYM